MSRRWLITGASGQLGRNLCALLAAGGEQPIGIHHAHAVDLPGVETVACNVNDLDALARIFDTRQPDVVVHAAGMTNVDLCESNESAARHLHADVAGCLADLAARAGRPMIYVSTDHLWRGDRALVDETVPPEPINAYARTKAEGETATLENHPSPLVVRTNFIGPGNPWKPAFLDWVVKSLLGDQPFNAFTDVYFTPLPVKTLCDCMRELVDRQLSGVFHVAGSERISKHDFVWRYAEANDLPTACIRPASIADATLKAPRPRDMSLSVGEISAALGRAMPDIGASLDLLASDPEPALSGAPTRLNERG